MTVGAVTAQAWRCFAHHLVSHTDTHLYPCVHALMHTNRLRMPCCLHRLTPDYCLLFTSQKGHGADERLWRGGWQWWHPILHLLLSSWWDASSPASGPDWNCWCQSPKHLGSFNLLFKPNAETWLHLFAFAYKINSELEVCFMLSLPLNQNRGPACVPLPVTKLHLIGKILNIL